MLRLTRRVAALVRVPTTFTFSYGEKAPWPTVYYESIKRDLKTRTIYECRCDERLKTKSEESTRLGHTGLLVERLKSLLFYHKSMKQKPKIKPIYELDLSVCVSRACR
jgi:hypothetical protein